MQDRPGQIDISEHLEIPGVAPDLVARVVEVSGRIRAGIVDENVDLRAGLRETLLVLDLAQIGAVNADVDARRSLAKHVARQLERGDTATRNIEVAAFSCERLGDRKADAFAGPSHKRALPLQLQVHRYPP